MLKKYNNVIVQKKVSKAYILLSKIQQFTHMKASASFSNSPHPAWPVQQDQHTQNCPLGVGSWLCHPNTWGPSEQVCRPSVLLFQVKTQLSPCRSAV